jgi:hypothetical protein
MDPALKFAKSAIGVVSLRKRALPDGPQLVFKFPNSREH